MYAIGCKDEFQVGKPSFIEEIQSDMKASIENALPFTQICQRVADIFPAFPKCITRKTRKR